MNNGLFNVLSFMESWLEIDMKIWCFYEITQVNIFDVKDLNIFGCNIGFAARKLLTYVETYAAISPDTISSIVFSE